MTVVAESGDRFVHHPAPQCGPESEYKGGVGLPKLNPSAKEFVPSSRRAGRKSDGRLSADAPSFDYYNSNISNCTNGNSDSSSDGSSGHLQKNHKRRNGYNQGRRRMNGKHLKEEMIRKTVYVSDIDQHVTEEALGELFKPCGTVVDCRVCVDPHSYLRFAFIQFLTESEAREALNLGGTMLGYYPLRVLPSKTAIVPVNPKFLPHDDDEREMVARTIYCTNIDKQVTQAEVKGFFEQYCGEVSRLRLLLDKKHSTCIAFVEFTQADSANLALSYSGMALGALPIRVSASKTAVRSRIPRATSH